MQRTIFIILLIFSTVYDLNAQRCLYASKKFGGFTYASQMHSAAEPCDTVFSFLTVDTYPCGLAFDGNSLWCSSGNTYDIFKYDLTGQLIKTIPNPTTGWPPGGDLDFDGTYLWFVAEQVGIAYRLDTANGNIISQFNLPSSQIPDINNFGCAYENGYLWTTEYNDQTLMRIDATTGVLVDSFVIDRSVLPLKILNNELYGLGNIISNPTLYHFNKNSGAIIDSLPWCLNFSSGFCQSNDHLFGLSSRFPQGTQRIYEFDSLFLQAFQLEIPKKELSLYPNPFSCEITLRIDSIYAGSNISFVIYNLLNQRIIHAEVSNNVTTFNFHDLAKGIYIYELRNKNGVIKNGKIVKE